MLRARIPNPSTRTRAVFVLASLLGLCTSAVRADGQPRYVARLASGRILVGDVLSNWYSNELRPHLAGQPLFSPEDPLRWLIDRALPPPEPPPAYVELYSGDRLPGRVVGYRTGTEPAFGRQPAHFLVQGIGTLGMNVERKTLVRRVDAHFVRRIVGRSSHDRPLGPRTVVLDDGRRLTFRSLRFSAREISLLVEGGVRRIPFGEIAELHLPPADFWPLAAEELAELVPDGEGRLLQVETADGLIATTSFTRCQQRTLGDERDSSRWVHGMQPAWSLDVLWVPQPGVWMRRSWSPSELPLPRLRPQREESRSPLGEVSYPAAANRNVRGGPLRAGRREAGWGIGVHAFSELEFELPPLARALTSEFGLDDSVGEGGAVAARIFYRSPKTPPLFQSPPLVGSAAIVPTGRLTWPASPEQNPRVVLQVDPLATRPPPGADPLDVRDHANWIDPLVELDGKGLRDLLRHLSPRRVTAWSGWDVALPASAEWHWAPFFAISPGGSGAHQLAVATRGGDLKLSNSARIPPGHRWLVLDAARLPARVPARVSVRIGDAAPASFELPAVDPTGVDLRPVVLPLPAAGPTGDGLRFEVVQAADGPPVLWRTLHTSAQHPLLTCILDDELPQPPPRIATPPVPPAVDDAVSYSGVRSYRVGPGEQREFPFGIRALVRERPQLGEVRFLRWAIRQPRGGAFRLEVRTTSGSVAIAYQLGEDPAGEPPDATPPVRRLPPSDAAQEWHVFTRDLYGDGANGELASLIVRAGGDQPLWIDHVFLARTQRDFELARSVAGH